MTRSTPHTAVHDKENEFARSLSRRLVTARGALGMSSGELARKLGVEGKTVEDWESGVRAPRSSRIAMLAGILGVSPSWLLDGHGDGPAADPADAGDGDLQQELRRLRKSFQSSITRIDRILGDKGGN